MEFIFFNEKHAKSNKKLMISSENHCFFCFRSFAAVFYYKIFLKNKKRAKTRTRHPPPPPSYLRSYIAKVY